MNAKDNNIKSVSTYRYPKFFFEETQDAEGKKCFLEQQLTFDNFGNVLSEVYYSEDGNLEHKIVRTFDDNKHQLSELLYYSEDEVAEEMLLVRDLNAKLIKKIKKYADGGDSITTFSYNDAGLPIRISTKDADGDIEEEEIYDYNGELIIKKVVVNSYNEQESCESFVYDSENRVVEHVVENPDSYERMLRVYDGELLKAVEIYGKNENGLKKYEYTYDENKKPIEINERGKMGASLTKLSYDEFGNDILEELFIGGNLTQRIMREYDEFHNMTMTAFWNENKEFGLINSYTQISKYDFF